MAIKSGRWLVAAAAILLLAVPVFSQNIEPENKKLKSASLEGTTGLFKVWDAETLRRSEANFSIGADRHYRDPGDLRFTLMPVGVAFGLTNRLEVFASMNPLKYVDARNIQSYRVLPGALPVPAATPQGAPSFNNAAPFIDVPTSTGWGDIQFGGKVNLLSEKRKNPFALGLVGFVRLPNPKSITVLNRGLSKGAWDGGFGLLISKVAGTAAELYANALVDFIGNAEKNGVLLADLQNEVRIRAGGAFPAQKKLQAIIEAEGTVYFGTRTFGANPRNPLDLIAGFRAYPREWFSFGAGYQATLNHIDEQPTLQRLPAGTHGFVAQLAFGRRVNYPPTVNCTAPNASIKQDDTTTIRASAVDPDGDPLSYSWATTGGKITGSGDTVTFDATGIAPGKYTVTATVSDDRYTATCSSDINVIKKNLAPTVSCSPGSSTVIVGQSSTIRASASDPNNDQLTYTWTINQQRVASAGPEMVFGSEGRQPGNYTVNVTVSDGELSASCSSTVTVQPKPNVPPTIECVICSADVAAGSTAQLQVRSSDPDNDKLTTTWTSTCGSVRGEGDSATFDSTGLHAGTCTVTATVDDGRGGRASANMTVNVSESITLSGFQAGRFRVDNEMKAALDDIAVRMQNNQQIRANIIGYTDNTNREKRVKALGQKRAQAVADYLISKGVDASRITVNDGAASNPVADNKTEATRKPNRRVEIELSVR